MKLCLSRDSLKASTGRKSALIIGLISQKCQATGEGLRIVIDVDLVMIFITAHRNAHVLIPVRTQHSHPGPNVQNFTQNVKDC